MKVVNIRRYINDCIKEYKQNMEEYEAQIEQVMLVEGKFRSLVDRQKNHIETTARRVLGGIKGSKVRYGHQQTQQRPQRPQRPEAPMQVKLKIAEAYTKLFRKKRYPMGGGDIIQVSSSIISDLEKDMTEEDMEVVLRTALQITVAKKASRRCLKDVELIERDFPSVQDGHRLLSAKRWFDAKEQVYKIRLMVIIKKLADLFKPSYADFEIAWSRILAVTRTVINCIKSELRDVIVTLEMMATTYLYGCMLGTFGDWIKDGGAENMESNILENVVHQMDVSIRVVRAFRELYYILKSIDDCTENLGHEVSELDLASMVDKYRSLRATIDVIEKHKLINCAHEIDHKVRKKEAIRDTRVTWYQLLG